MARWFATCTPARRDAATHATSPTRFASVVKPISPYLLRPLRSLAEVLREADQRAAGDAAAEPSPTPSVPAEAAAKPANPKDSVTIGGVDMPVDPGEQAAPTTGGQIDVKA